MVRQEIETKLQAAFKPSHLEVIDESYRHNVPAGSESHFKVIVISNDFIEQRMISRHRSVYSILAKELDEGVHALALHTYTEKEWAELGDSVLASPACRGGSSTTSIL
ncbi:transcriptional regulator BolA [Xenorhabdus nematophila]|uniref:DNA-binding transcriptional regulator BolA n=1 Tax=Xenorhabdus nematophila (strain ATCC 19061 / DSM 3370 / CCUG 14189 / LMG 1036 / NCIMB 9965 / AN6) TaxID=406817 RepID=D3VL98_XENNA|nr:transcriptional regulator BolA [Xenorhabdus nematophila]CEE91077.1 transcriptional activator of morphogenic pathway (BolA family), important in general stress response [Xenorhabdus nematophila str. Anatoliense]CEF31390.1 transcriptional activator of morphogenic pathway (BolA family), important in general stress response [Xenorhabdus nematophila str. Websteri]AYA40957.1 transcriptional regulator BolA [Xenorhabdus nematophila]KHD28114.1 transcriptional regulator BolA [Xenorhabdus nematophila]